MTSGLTHERRSFPSLARPFEGAAGFGSPRRRQQASSGKRRSRQIIILYINKSNYVFDVRLMPDALPEPLPQLPFRPMCGTMKGGIGTRISCAYCGIVGKYRLPTATSSASCRVRLLLLPSHDPYATPHVPRNLFQFALTFAIKSNGSHSGATNRARLLTPGIRS